MSEKVLFVDDDPNLLDGIKRQLKKEFHIETAPGPEQGLAAMSGNGSYAVVVSDMRMPVMDGIQFLGRVKEIAPDSVCVILTGHADLNTAIEAVNRGTIFRFLTKPCEPEVLTQVLNLGIHQYRLITAERELLEKTLKGTVKVLTELLALVNPEAFGRSSRILRYVREIALHLRVAEVWRLETAALLSQMGCVVVPEKALLKHLQCLELNEEEGQLFDMHAMVSSDLIAHIPRLEEVAEIIRYQEKHFDGSGNPRDARQGEGIPLGARILKIALDFDILQTRGVPQGEALAKLRERTGWYDPALLEALEAILAGEVRQEIRAVAIPELEERMILVEDIVTEKGQILFSRDQEVSPVLLEGVRNFAKTAGIKQPIRVAVPVQAEQ